MKTILITLLLLPSLCWPASIPLKATWNPSTDTVTVGYKLYRTDGVRTLIATIPGKTPVQPFNFTVTVPDGSTGTLKFIMTGYSTTKESADSVTATYPFDLSLSPAIPSSFTVQPQ